MTKTRVVLGLMLAAVVAVACSSSSGPTTYAITGGCSDVVVGFAGRAITLSGPCNLGAAGQYTIGVSSLPVNLGACGPTAVPATNALWTQGTSVLSSTFTGNANIPCDGGVIDLTQPITLSGAFAYDGGTGPFVDASGIGAVADGGVTTTTGITFTASLPVSGSLSY